MGMGLVIWLLVIALVAILAVFIIDKTLPAEMNWIAKAIVGIILLIAILSKLGALTGVGI